MVPSLGVPRKLTMALPTVTSPPTYMKIATMPTTHKHRDGTPHRDLAADIHEDRQHAQGGVWVFEGAGAGWNLIGVRKRGHMGEFEEHRQQHEGGGKAQERDLHREIGR